MAKNKASIPSHPIPKLRDIPAQKRIKGKNGLVEVVPNGSQGGGHQVIKWSSTDETGKPKGK